MSSLFGGAPDPEPVPTADNSAAEMNARQEQERRARGRASTILTSPEGLLSEPQTASTVLLGT